jgi:hypothetical protein
MIYILIAIFLFLISKSSNTTTSFSLAGKALATVSTPVGNSSTPIPVPAPTGSSIPSVVATPVTPIFYQENNAATTQSPTTSQSFTPLRPVPSTEIFPATKAPTALHNILLTGDALQANLQRLQNFSRVPAVTENYSVYEDVNLSQQNVGVPHVTQVSTAPTFGVLRANEGVATVAPNSAPAAVTAPHTIAPLPAPNPRINPVITIAEKLAINRAAAQGRPVPFISLERVYGA